MARRRTVVVRAALALLVFGLILAGVIAAHAVRQLRAQEPIRVAAFYRPLTDGPPAHALARRLGIAILTRTDEGYRDALRRAGYHGPMLQYLLANQASGPPSLVNASSPCGEYPSYPNNPTGIGGDFCAALHGDERNFLHNGRGERLYSTQSWQAGGATGRAHLYLMNPASPAWRAYLARHARHEIQELGYDGIFLDNVDLSLYRGRWQQANSDGMVAEYPSDATYRETVAALLQAVRSEMGPPPIWANLTNGTDSPTDWDTYLPHLDGVMEEAFVGGWEGRLADRETWERQVRQAEATLRQGKGFVAVAQGERDDVSRLRFSLATYLLVADDGASFRYADGSGGENTSPAYYSLWTYDEYGLALGPALGNRYRDGQVWRRDFSCGSVEVHVEERRGTMTADAWCRPYFWSLPMRIIGQASRPAP